MILKNRRTRETLEIDYSEFRKRFAKDIQQSFESYKQTQLNKSFYGFKDDNSMEFNFYFQIQYNLRIASRGCRCLRRQIPKCRLTRATKNNSFGNSAWCIERLYMDVNFTSEKSKQIALARLDLIHQWQEFRGKSTNKLSADYDFVKLHNTSNNHLFEILGKISRGSLHRWKNLLNGSENYTLLLPQYKYSCIDEYRTVLTDEEIKIFMGLLLHPNRLSIGKATALTKYKLQQQGQNFISADITFRRYAKWYKDNNYDK